MARSTPSAYFARPKALSVAALRWCCDPSELGFDSTDDVDDIVRRNVFYDNTTDDLFLEVNDSFEKVTGYEEHVTAHAAACDTGHGSVRGVCRR